MNKPNKKTSKNSQKGNKNKEKTNANRSLLIGTLIFIIMLVGLYFIDNPVNNDSEITLSELVSKINEEKVEKIEVSGTNAIVSIKDEDKEKVVLKEEGTDLSTTLKDLGVDSEKLKKVDYSAKEESLLVLVLLNVFPLLLTFGVVGVLFWYIAKQIQRGNGQALNFGRSKARFQDPKEKTKEGKTKFKDIAGSKEAKEELWEVVDFLKDPIKFSKMGAKIPKGVLLVGPPGTGKTMLTRGVSNEAGVPFFTISGSEFVEMFVGVGASRVRDLFSTAKKKGPAIIFIDEIDAVGRKRGAGLGGSHDEREQTLNQILVEMDGFDNNTGVIVMAATNRPDILDSALLRPGRFDRRIMVSMPDLKEREAILKVHAVGKFFDKDVNFKELSQRTVGFSGADLGNLVNEAAILAVREKQNIIKMSFLRESIERVMMGPSRKSRVMTEKEKRLTAYHEAGHAVVGHYLKNTNPVQKITIIPRGMAGGYTMSPPKEDRSYKTKKEFLDDMAMTLGGYVAEEKIFGEVSTGPSNDLEKVSSMARGLVRKYGMSKLGPIVFDKKDNDLVFLGNEFKDHQEYGDKTADEIDKEVNRLVLESLNKAREVIKDKKAILERLAEKLLEKEIIEREEFESLMDEKEKK